MHRKYRPTPKSFSSAHSAEAEVHVLPSLATAEQIAAALQVSSRTVLLWSVAGTIPTALRCGKVVRFHPPDIAASLGLKIPEFGVSIEQDVTPSL